MDYEMSVMTGWCLIKILQIGISDNLINILIQQYVNKYKEL